MRRDSLIRRLEKANMLGDTLSDITPSDWRALLIAAAFHRCVACGELDACRCNAATDEAKALVVDRARDLQSRKQTR
jgi:hypothetical protein